MSIEKRWNNASFPTGTTIFGTNASYPITCSGVNTFVNLHNADIVVNLTVNNLSAGGSYAIVRPTTAWISQANITITYQTSEGEKIVNYPAFINRGTAGNVLELLEYSEPKFGMYNPIEYLTASNGLTNVNFDVLIPLKFLADVAYDPALLNVDNIVFNITWESQDRCFQSLDPIKIQSNSVNINYYTMVCSTPDIIPMKLREIPNRQIYIQTIDLLAGSNAANTQIAVPFPSPVLFYYFVNVNGAYNLNPNPLSVVNSHSLTGMSTTYPLIANYNAKYVPGVTEVGMIRHYIELMKISGKDKPENSSHLSYDTWRDSLRIYAIEIGTEQSKGQNFNFQSTFSAATSVSSTCVMIFMGRRMVM